MSVSGVAASDRDRRLRVLLLRSPRVAPVEGDGGLARILNGLSVRNRMPLASRRLDWTQTAIFSTSFCVSAANAFYLIARNIARVAAVSLLGEFVLTIMTVRAEPSLDLSDLDVSSPILVFPGFIVMVFLCWDRGVVRFPTSCEGEKYTTLEYH